MNIVISTKQESQWFVLVANSFTSCLTNVAVFTYEACEKGQHTFLLLMNVIAVPKPGKWDGDLCKKISNRLHATCGGGQTELRRGIHIGFYLSFYTAQYM